MSARNDNYANLVTGLAGPGDKDQYSFFQRERRLFEQELNNMYEGSGMAARIVDRVVDDSTREGFRFEGDPSFDFNSIKSEIEDLKVVYYANKVSKTARLYGGAILVPDTDDPGSYEDELDLNNVSKLNGFWVYPSNRVQPDCYQAGFGNDAYTNPEFYLITGVNASQTRIHRSRCIRVEGVPLLSPYRYAERNGWGPSVLERVASEMARLGQAEGYVAACMHDISVWALKMPKLHEMMCGGDEQREEAAKILEGFSNLRDNLHIQLMDTDDLMEEVKRDLSGFAPLIELFVSAVLREENMPRTILTGEQPGGLGSSSSDEVRGWYDFCQGWQAPHLTPIYSRIMEILFAVRRNNGEIIPTEWTISYDSLWQPDAATQASTLLTSAQAYQLLITMGILTVLEARAEMVAKGLITVGVAIPGYDPTGVVPPGGEPEAAPSAKPVPPDLCSTKEAAARLGIPTLAVNNLCRKGELPYWGFGAHKQVSMADVLSLGKAHETPPASEADPESEVG